MVLKTPKKGESLPTMQLFPIEVPSGLRLIVSLHGGDHASKSKVEFFLKSSRSQDATWNVSAGLSEANAKPVGKFQYSDGSLGFQWDAAAGSVSNAASLVNCGVRIKAADFAHDVALRAPVISTPILFEKSFTTSSESKLENPPNPDNIKIVLVGVPKEFPVFTYIKNQDFLEKIAELTPHSNRKNNKFYVKKTKSLDSTKKYFNESQSLTGVELKEFSLLYLVMNNLTLLQANIHLIENIRLFTEVNRQIFEAMITKLRSGEQINIEDLSLDKQLLDKINKFAPIKYILKNKPNDDRQIIELLDDISRDLVNYDLEFRIQELESKFSKDMSETTFNELKELKKKQNIN